MEIHEDRLWDCPSASRADREVALVGRVGDARLFGEVLGVEKRVKEAFEQVSLGWVRSLVPVL